MRPRIVRTALAFAFAAGLAPDRQVRAQAREAAPWNVFSVRYDTRTSDFIYAVYGYGNSFAMAGVLHNPRSDYSEVLGAVGRKFAVRDGPTQFAAIGVARASESWYLQAYFLPTLRRGRVWLRATSELYVPTEGMGTAQFALSPVAVTAEVLPRLEAGFSSDVATARHSVASTAVGPQLRLALPNAVIGVEAQRVVHQSAGRVRVFFLSSF